MKIDTGVSPAGIAPTLDKVEAILDGVLDSLHADATQEQIDAAVVLVLLGYVRGPKKAETVRRRIVQLWPLIAPLAEREPHLFDSVLNEFCEVVSTLR
jgi:hypothetical protein